MNKKSIRDVDFNGKRVLVRVDFNVPVEGNVVTDDTRVRASIPTLRYIIDQKPKSVVLMSHFGRPKGGRDPKYSLAPVAPVLGKHLALEVSFADDCVGSTATDALAALPEGGILLVENTRFHDGETKNDPELAAQLAKLGDIFVNDAFGSAHRAHSSTVGVTSFLPAVAGFLLEKEIDYLGNTIENPERPFIAILGGAKVSDKIAVIKTLLDKVDKLLIGGGMANTFFKAQGIWVGKSLAEDEALDTAKSLLKASGDKLVLPVDAVIGDAFDNDANRQRIEIADGVPDKWAIYDIGDKTVELFSKVLAEAQTIVWNGPMGVFEMPNFAQGTFAIARLLADATSRGAVTIVGGGDSAAAIEDSGLSKQITHISTGGGASLEMLEGKILPGVAALTNK